MTRTLLLANRLIFGLSVLFLCAASHATLLEQKPVGAINDFAGILSPETVGSLERLSGALQQKIGVSLVLVTAKSLDGGDIDDVANKLFKAWGIGRKGVDEGVLVLVALSERAIRIETGYGTEGYITDAQSKRIIRDIATPYLSKGQWDQGLFNTFVALADLAAKAHNSSLNIITGDEAPNVTGLDGRKNIRPNAFTIVLGVLLLLFLVGTRMGRSILFMLILSSVFSGGRSGYGSSGFGGGFGRGGGFGGFGGGMSGGGGASGRF